MSLIKLLGDVDGIVSIKTHLKGAFGFSRFLDLDFLFIEEIWHDVQKRSGSILSSIYITKHSQYPQLTIIWWVCDLIFHVVILKQFSFYMVISFSLTYTWFYLEMHVSFVHYVVMLFCYSPLLGSIRCKTLCEKDKCVLNSLT